MPTAGGVAEFERWAMNKYSLRKIAIVLIVVSLPIALVLFAMPEVSSILAATPEDAEEIRNSLFALRRAACNAAFIATLLGLILLIFGIIIEESFPRKK